MESATGRGYETAPQFVTLDARELQKLIASAEQWPVPPAELGQVSYCRETEKSIVLRVPSLEALALPDDAACTFHGGDHLEKRAIAYELHVKAITVSAELPGYRCSDCPEGNEDIEYLPICRVFYPLAGHILDALSPDC